jgi:hypothetical protein
MPAILIHALAVHAAAGPLTVLRAGRPAPSLAAASPIPRRRPRRGCPVR